MAKRDKTKAQGILDELTTEIESTRELLDKAEAEVAKHGTKLNVLVSVYSRLEKSLARAPRKASTLKTDKKEQPTLKEVPKVERCTVCGNEEDYQDHFEPSPNYHVFQGKKAKGAA